MHMHMHMHMRALPQPSHNLLGPAAHQATVLLHARAWHAILSRKKDTRFCAWPRLSPRWRPGEGCLFTSVCVSLYIAACSAPPGAGCVAARIPKNGRGDEVLGEMALQTACPWRP